MGLVFAAAEPSILREHLMAGNMDLAIGGIWYNTGRDEYVDYSCWNVADATAVLKGPLATTALDSAELVNDAAVKLCIPVGWGTIADAEAVFPNAVVHTTGITSAEMAFEVGEG